MKRMLFRQWDRQLERKNPNTPKRSGTDLGFLLPSCLCHWRNKNFLISVFSTFKIHRHISIMDFCSSNFLNAANWPDFPSTGEIYLFYWGKYGGAKLDTIQTCSLWLQWLNRVFWHRRSYGIPRHFLWIKLPTCHIKYCNVITTTEIC